MDNVVERRKNDAQLGREALGKVLEERDYQRKRWLLKDDQCYTIQDWTNILGTWMGKVHSSTYSQQGFAETPERRRMFKKRVTQLGAICLAALEAVED